MSGAICVEGVILSNLYPLLIDKLITKLAASVANLLYAFSGVIVSVPALSSLGSIVECPSPSMIVIWLPSESSTGFKPVALLTAWSLPKKTFSLIAASKFGSFLS